MLVLGFNYHEIFLRDGQLKTPILVLIVGHCLFSFVSALIRVISYKVGGNIRDLGMRIIVLGVKLFLEALRNYYLSD